MKNVLQDFSYALRTLRKAPGFATIAIITLALGVGANTAIFSVTNSVLLHPHRFPELDRLVVLREQVQGRAGEQSRLTAADAADLAAKHGIFQDVATYQYRDLNLSRSGETDKATGFLVSPNLFHLLGIECERGRTFPQDEGQPGYDQVLLLSHGFWQRRFGGDPSIVGSTISVDGTNATVIGIMPRDFNYPAGAEVWKPLSLTPEKANDRTTESLGVVARLAPGMSLNQARSALASAASRLQQEFPGTNAGRSFDLIRLREEQYSDTAPLLLMLQSGALFVLLLACANLGVLILIRLIGRRREFAVRTALGASKRRLLQMFFAEALLFCMAAGSAAVCASFWGVNQIRTSLSPSYTRWVVGWDSMRVDGYVLIVAVSVVILVALVLGVAAVLHAAGIDPYSTMKEGGRAGMSRSHNLLRNGLVVVQITLALVLLVGAGLMVNGFRRLQGVFATLDPAHTLRFEISLPELRYKSAEIPAFYDHISAELASVPGVQTVGMITNNPASNVPNSEVQFSIEGQEVARAAETPIAGRQIVNPGVFSAVHLSLVNGRLLSNSDGANSPRVAVVSRTLAQRYWLDGSAVGHRIRFSSDSPWLTIVGVVSDIQLNWFDPIPEPVVYLPYAQAPPRRLTFLVRTLGDAANYRSAVRKVISSLDPLLSSGELNPYTVEVDDSLAPLRVIGNLMLAFGVVALLLSAIGIYGVVGHAVAQSTHEFGVRMALGAARGDVLSLVLGRALRIAVIGLVLGCGLAFVLARLARALVFGVVSLNASVFLGFSLLLLTVALFAAFLPARRAARVDPIAALRWE
jgi:putative ABC transport system permease protein